MNKLDFDFRLDNIRHISDLVDMIKSHKVDFNDEVSDDRIIDLCLARLKLGYVNVNWIVNTNWKVVRGHKLFSTIKKYIIDDEPFSNLVIFNEYNGKRFSELQGGYKRRILETNVTIFFSNYEDAKEALEYYSSVLNDFE